MPWGEYTRFRVRVSPEVGPTLRVGERYVAEPAEIVEQWRPTGLMRPVRIDAFERRVGVIESVRPPDQPGFGERGWEAILSDVEPAAFPVEALLTVLGSRNFGDFTDTQALLDHLSHGQVGGDAARQAAFARAITPWLASKHPDVARAAAAYDRQEAAGRIGHEDDTAWLCGVKAVLGDTVFVDVPPLRFTYEPPPPTLSPSLRVKGDVLSRLLRRGRAN